MDASVAERLQQPVPSRYLREKPIGGGQHALYVPADILFQQANNVFGVSRWSSRVLKLETDYLVQDASSQKWSAACTAIVRVTLMTEDGRPLCFHDDVGTGAAHRLPQLERAMDTAKKYAVTDARKRCLRLFGPAVGGGMSGAEGQTAARAAMKATSSSAAAAVRVGVAPVAVAVTSTAAGVRASVPARPATAPSGPGVLASRATPAPASTSTAAPVRASSAVSTGGDFNLGEFEDYELQDAIYAAALVDGDTTRYTTSTLLAVGAAAAPTHAAEGGPGDMFGEDFEVGLISSQQLKVLESSTAANVEGDAQVGEEGRRKRARMADAPPAPVAAAMAGAVAGRAPIYDTIDSTHDATPRTGVQAAAGHTKHTPPVHAPNVAAAMGSSGGSMRPPSSSRGAAAAPIAAGAAPAAAVLPFPAGRRS